MTPQTAYVEKAKAQLREWNAAFDLLRAKMGTAAVSARVGIERELDALKDKEMAVEKKLEDVFHASGKAWDEVKSGFETGWHDVQTALEKAKAAIEKGR